MNELEQAENKLEQAELEKLESQPGLDEDTIELVEELRRDLPQVENRHDPEVEALKQNVNPHEVVSNLNQLIKEAAQEEAAQEEE